MHQLASNIFHLCTVKGITTAELYASFGINIYHDLSLSQIDLLAGFFSTAPQSLLFKNLQQAHSRAHNIKLLVLDVDGVMTDSGMYFTETGSQFKKYNSKDGMAIMHLSRTGFQLGLISSGFNSGTILPRAKMLGIERAYVGRRKKMDILQEWCSELNLSLAEVAMIGDDINDLDILPHIGLSACPADAVERVRENVDMVLSAKGGEGCVREFIDAHLLKEPI